MGHWYKCILLQKDNLPSPQTKPQEQRQQPRKKNIPPPRPPSPKLASHAQPRNSAPPPTISGEGSDLSREEMHARLQELLGKRDKIDQLLEVNRQEVRTDTKKEEIFTLSKHFFFFKTYCTVI